MKSLICIAVVLAVVGAAHASIGALGGAVLAGPAGLIQTGIGGVGVVGPLGVAAPVSLGAAQAALSLSVPAGSGLEGQWIPDINERLHDNGQWRPLLDGSLAGISPSAGLALHG